jgi:hypothetical protein
MAQPIIADGFAPTNNDSRARRVAVQRRSPMALFSFG